ncbi:MAG: bifunctional salicylyl-CoA 5-hydroxylase/oxidoreductase [Myxococcales bacterium]|nr:bifunctional salicylyl-CoA 5-hydroxylase/oxidoreductase [Myxococcales bacterium]
MKIAVIGGGPGGLYFSLLMKKRHPEHEIEVVERNRARDTFGWGVVFSDGTLGNLEEADPESYGMIRASFVHWDDIDTHFGDQIIRSGGHGFCGLARRRLLEILQARCEEVGVTVHYERECAGPQEFPDADLIVAADGINSVTRTQLADVFQPSVEVNKAKFIWLGTTRTFEAFTFIIRENEHGLFQVHAYPFDGSTSTFIVETDERSWRRAGLDTMSVSDGVAYLERLFEPELQGHQLLTNNSTWINFRTITCERWWTDNIVLIGDAVHTAHFSIGSGTKLAMEDAIALADAVCELPGELPRALQTYYDRRWLDVAKIQRAAQVSRRWFEEIARYKGFHPQQLVLSMMTRSKRVTHENLRVRDEGYIARFDRWFADGHGAADVEPAPPPMFTPFKLRGVELHNRVVVSPMCQYSADDGTIDDWHLVHLGSRAIGGAALVIAEMTDVSRDGRISPGCAGLYKPEHQAAWRRVVEFVHEHSAAKIGIQLGHAGRKGSTKLLWEGYNAPLEDGGWALLGPSPIPWTARHQTPRPMTRADMDHVKADYVRAAEMAREAGFDLLELHCAHGYLLATFLSPLTNARDDEYGGSLANRARFPLEVLDAIRAVWPDDKPISVRISATDWTPGGFDEDDAVALARMLKDHGCDLVDVSAGQTSPEGKPVYGRMFQTPFSDRIRNEVGIPTIAVGNIQGWDHINTIIGSGRADLCALARPHLLDPYLTLHAAAEQGYDGAGARWPNQYVTVKPRPKG